MNSYFSLLSFLTLSATAFAQNSDEEIIGQVGQSVQIPFNITLPESEEIVTIVWRHGADNILQSVYDETVSFETRAFLHSNRSLTMSDLQLADSGEYTVVAVTRVYTYTSTTNLRVLASPTLSAISVSVVDYDSDEPQIVAICETTGGSPPYSVEWYNQAGEMLPNSTVSEKAPNQENSELIDYRVMLKRFVDASIDNGSQFKCVVADALGERKEESVSLIVTEPTTTIPTTTLQAYPKIIDFQEEGTINLAKGDTRNILCQATGVPEPKIVWTKDGEQIGQGIGEDEMSIFASDYSISGRYKCTATNEEGADSKTVTVNIQGKPVISDKNGLVNNTEEINLKRNVEIVTLSCEAASNPPSMISWSVEGKNRMDLDIKEDSESDYDKVVSYFNISTKHFTGKDPASTVICVASNSLGEDKKLFKIQVVDASQASNTGLIIGVILAILIALPLIALILFLVKRRKDSAVPDEETGGLIGFATGCGGSKVKSKELSEDDDGVGNIKEISEEGSQEEKQKLTQSEEEPAKNEDDDGVGNIKEISEEGSQEEKQKLTQSEEEPAKNEDEKDNSKKDEDEIKTEEKPKKEKRKISLPIQCCRGKKKTITKKEMMNEDESGEEENAQNEGTERDSGKGDTLEKVIEEDTEKK